MDIMRKYRNAMESIQKDYEFFIDQSGWGEHVAFTYCNAKLMGLTEVAIYDMDLTMDEFQEINNYRIERRDRDA